MKRNRLLNPKITLFDYSCISQNESQKTIKNCFLLRFELAGYAVKTQVTDYIIKENRTFRICMN